MKFLGKLIPAWQNVLLAMTAAVLLILAFPDFEFWFLAWFALVPLMWAVEREKASILKSFVLGWLFGTIFFFATCWWLTFAPITYAGFPWPLAYFLLFGVTAVTGMFPAAFAAILAVLLRRFGSWTFLAAPFVWVFTEFLRYWVTGNNWNAIGYSQADVLSIVSVSSIGGVHGASFIVLSPLLIWGLARLHRVGLTQNLTYSQMFRGLYARSTMKFAWPGAVPTADVEADPDVTQNVAIALTLFILAFIALAVVINWVSTGSTTTKPADRISSVIALQPNVPMSGLDQNKWRVLRERQIGLVEAELSKLPPANRQLPTVVILPESPMNFMYNDDREFQQFIHDFAKRNNVSVLFNSAEPDATNGKYFNSAVMVSPEGSEAAQYDKIYLLPFGEAVPPPLEGILPGFVGNFSYGREYDLLLLGDAKAGVMICFESHFGQLSREYVRNGADAIIEMTNDGYLGPTPVLRQHLANAVFRAVETNRPVLRVTNVGITAYIDERGNVHDPAPVYTEATRIWTVSKSDGSQTFYVKYGDWFAWSCTIVTIGFILLSFRRKRD